MKRNTSKLIVIFLMTLMLAAVLAGCGSKKGIDGYYIGEFYLYDGVHHLSAVNYGDSYINSTVISGEKIANVPHEMFVELTEHIGNEYLGSMLITLGQNSEPFNYQISFTEEDAAEYNGMEKNLSLEKQIILVLQAHIFR